MTALEEIDYKLIRIKEQCKSESGSYVDEQRAAAVPGTWHAHSASGANWIGAGSGQAAIRKLNAGPGNCTVVSPLSLDHQLVRPYHLGQVSADHHLVQARMQSVTKQC